MLVEADVEDHVKTLAVLVTGPRLLRPDLTLRVLSLTSVYLASLLRILIMVAPAWISTVASVGMAVGPPLVYADQAFSMVRKKRVILPDT